MSRQLGGNDYDDISNEIPTEEEWRRAGDATHECQPQVRLRGKRSAPTDIEEALDREMDNPQPQPGVNSFSSGRRQEQEPADMEIDDPQPGGDSSGSGLRREREPVQEEDGDLLSGSRRKVRRFRCSTTMMGKCRIGRSLPRITVLGVGLFCSGSRGGDAKYSNREKILPDLKAFLVNALKKKAVEVYEKNMSPEELAEFKSAKSVEVPRLFRSTTRSLEAGLLSGGEDALGAYVEAQGGWYETSKGKSSTSRVSGSSIC